MPTQHCGPSAARFDLYLDSAALAVLDNLEKFYRDRVGVRQPRHVQGARSQSLRSPIIRRALDELEASLRSVLEAPEEDPRLIREKLTFSQYRRARRPTVEDASPRKEQTS
jgi:hypothetical protein